MSRLIRARRIHWTAGPLPLCGGLLILDECSRDRKKDQPPFFRNRHEQYMGHRPLSPGQTRRHGRGTIATAAESSNPHLQRLVNSAEMIIGQSPLDVQPQVLDIIGHWPSAARQRSDEFPQGQIVSLNKGCLNMPAQIRSQQPGLHDGSFAEPDDALICRRKAM